MSAFTQVLTMTHISSQPIILRYPKYGWNKILDNPDTWNPHFSISPFQETCFFSLPTVFSVCWWCFRTMVTLWHAEKSTESTTWGIPSSVQTTSNYCWTQPSTNRWLKLEKPPVPQVLVACLFDETSSIENLTIVPIWHRKKMTPSHLTVTSHQCQVHFKVSPWGGENLLCFVMFFLFLLYIKPAPSPTKG